MIHLRIVIFLLVFSIMVSECSTAKVNENQIRPKVVALISLPKSGTDYLYKYLIETFDAHVDRALSIYFFASSYQNDRRKLIDRYMENKEINIDGDKFKKWSDLGKGSILINSHFFGESNHRYGPESTWGFDKFESLLKLFKQHSIPVIINVRDPRQATLSHIRYIEPDQLGGKSITNFPEKYSNSSLKERIDYWLKNDDLFLGRVKWIENWIDLIESENYPNVLITTYDEIFFDSQKLKDKIYKFVINTWGLESGDATFKIAKENTFSHFREGKLNEFSSIFSSEQLETANKEMERLFNYFNWDKVITKHDYRISSTLYPSNLLSSKLESFSNLILEMSENQNQHDLIKQIQIELETMWVKLTNFLHLSAKQPKTWMLSENIETGIFLPVFANKNLSTTHVYFYEEKNIVFEFNNRKITFDNSGDPLIKILMEFSKKNKFKDDYNNNQIENFINFINPISAWINYLSMDKPLEY